MKSILKKFIWGVLILIIAEVIFVSMTVPYNGLMWILKAILFWTLVFWGCNIVTKCDIECNEEIKNR
jgi:hypothetical protein